MTTSETTHEPEMPPDGGQPTPNDDDLAGGMARAEAELKSCQDRLLRALAEQENTRRRAERDRAEAVRFAASGLARDLLSTADNLRRAIEAVPEAKAADETVAQLLTGLVATERVLLEALGKHGIRPIEALGQPFDPSRHEAVYKVESDGRPAGTVTEVLQPGYLHHDRLLRPAMVGVAAKGSGSNG